MNGYRTPLVARMARTRRSSGFSLIELLTVIFIISLLIAVLLPSLGRARDQAKRVSTSGLLHAVEAGLEMFKNDNEAEFGRTNGYPPSFAHPPIFDENGEPVFTKQDAVLGKYPFVESTPRVYGAHFLVAFLMGVDLNGFVPRRSVPKKLLAQPWKWYEPDQGNNNQPLQRTDIYLDSSELRVVPTNELIGTRPKDAKLFPDWDDLDMTRIPVIVDSFDQPVLYYAAIRGGSNKNMIERKRKANNRYPDGKPIYFHQDNEGFTGTGDGPNNRSPVTEGWDFGAGGRHKIARHGEKLTSKDIDTLDNKDTFARYVLDRDAFDAIKDRRGLSDIEYPLRPVHQEGYLLITAGPDGLFGTNDDVTNIPRQD